MDGIKWIEICKNTYKLKVPGGWVIRYETYMMIENDDCLPVGGITACMCFVPEK